SGVDEAQHRNESDINESLDRAAPFRLMAEQEFDGEKIVHSRRDEERDNCRRRHWCACPNKRQKANKVDDCSCAADQDVKEKLDRNWRSRQIIFQYAV